MITGWTFDPDEPSKQLSIHVYIDGPAGSGSFLGSATSNTLRQDVDDVYHTGAYHGFVANFSASPGKHDIYVYAIDSAGGNNPQLGKSTVNVPAVDDTRRVLPDGDYAIVLTSTLDSNPYYYLDVYGTDLPAANGTNVNIAGGTNKPTSLPNHELWSIKWKNGYYEITQIGTNLALDVASAGGQNNANVMVSTSHGGANQQWTISKNGDGYRIKSRSNGRSLDNQNGLLEQANNVAVHDDNDSVAQRWSFIPVNRDISQASVSAIGNQTYSGSAITPKPTVTWQGVTLVEGTDYTLSYANNTAVGTATITISGKDSYSGSNSTTFKIVSASISGASVTAADQTYTGSALTPAVTVKLGGKTLVSGTDYTVSYSNNVNVGTATITVTGKGNYAGTATGSFKINTASISGASVTASDQTYTGSALTPAVTVILNGKTLVSGTDYTVAYSNNVNVGTATITVTGKGNYAGTATGSFKISAAPKTNIAGASVTAANQTYTGSVLTPAVTVVLNGKTLVSGTDYTVAYSNNVNVGTATIIVTGMGDYTGTATGSFRIVSAAHAPG